MQSLTQSAIYLAIQITGSADEAMDIVQTATIKSMEHRNAPKPDAHGYKAWFFRVVHNQAIDWLRKEKKFDRAADLSSQQSDEDPVGSLEQEQRKLLLHQALNRLGADQREIICLRDFHEFSYADIAQIMGIEKGTVMSRLHRARMALRGELVEVGLFTGDDDEL